ncbi:XRE family transcriptional regulator [Amycolatopsis sp.]|uniref:helix-turn-helix domain-containing protein n=1 Tax=Amycolatopsis sp. TaxID=37632 RepID=UPI00261631C0|nr:XRE family transcriptional regulator [Amycolatopsis sp.]
MDLLPTSDQLGDFARLLGDELRTVRKNRCWTRKQLRAQMNPDDELSLKTLATYELGTRRMTVERLLEVCAALDEPPDELLRRAKERAFVDPGHGHIDVNLEALARTENPQLAQFRRWAAVRASQGPQGSQAIERLDSRALVALANLASISLQQLVGALRELRSAAG